MRQNKPVLIFLVVRLVLMLSLPLEALTAYGDMTLFERIARLPGWPFLDAWMEYPPVFPFFSELVSRLAGDRTHVYIYVFYVLFSLFQAAGIALFLRIAKILSPSTAENRTWWYMALLTGLFYGWANIDAPVVFALLLGIWYTLEAKPVRASLAFVLGGLVKWFPLFGLPALLRRFDRKGLLAGALAAAILLGVWGSLYLASPDYTLATFRSQSAKGSWETVWALIDGNLTTGSFGAPEQRADPAAALVATGSPARISSLLTLVPFALFGLWAYFRSSPDTPRGQIALTGLVFTLFFLWSPGWSPQWVLYLLPLVLLLLPLRTAGLMALLLVLVNLLEWPVLLSRGMFWGLYLTVPLRTFLVGLLGWEFWGIVRRGESSSQQVSG